jgi:hypothetical protein
MRPRSWFWLYAAGAAAVVGVSAACHKAPPVVASAPVAADGGEIGDTTAFGVRIVGFNPMRDRATYLLNVPAYVVAIAVIPGKTVEIVGRHPVGDTAMRTPGVNQVIVAIARPAGVTPSQPRVAERLDFQKCVDRHVRARTRRTKTTKTVRDSTGKTVVLLVEEVDEPLDAEREGERRCGGILTRQGPDALPPEPNRYLVLLASQAQLTPAELHARLDAMTVTASDVRGTVEAIGDALYFDRRAIWSGHYTRW